MHLSRLKSYEKVNYLLTLRKKPTPRTLILEISIIRFPRTKRTPWLLSYSCWFSFIYTLTHTHENQSIKATFHRKHQSITNHNTHTYNHTHNSPSASGVTTEFAGAASVSPATTGASTASHFGGSAGAFEVSTGVVLSDVASLSTYKITINGQ